MLLWAEAIIGLFCGALGYGAGMYHEKVFGYEHRRRRRIDKAISEISVERLVEVKELLAKGLSLCQCGHSQTHHVHEAMGGCQVWHGDVQCPCKSYHPQGTLEPLKDPSTLCQCGHQLCEHSKHWNLCWHADCACPAFERTKGEL